MEKQPQRPVLGALETQLSFEEAQSLCAMEDMPVEAFSFTGGGAPGAQLAKSEWRGCALKGVCLRGADLRGAYFRDVSFLNCDFAGAALIGATLHRCAFEDCRLTGANFSAGALADVRFLDVYKRQPLWAGRAQCCGRTWPPRCCRRGGTICRTRPAACLLYTSRCV